MNRLIPIILIAIILLVACKKEKPTAPEPLPALPNYMWKNYIGVYDVYDTVNHTQWVMKLSHIRHNEYNQGNNDSMLIENFANKFTFKFKWLAALTTSRNPAFALGIFHPIKDMNNLNWHLGCAWDDASTAKEENVLKNDSMTIFFNLSNIAFYQGEGVPYYSCDCKHIAVKRK